MTLPLILVEKCQGWLLAGAMRILGFCSLVWVLSSFSTVGTLGCKDQRDQSHCALKLSGANRSIVRGRRPSAWPWEVRSTTAHNVTGRKTSRPARFLPSILLHSGCSQSTVTTSPLTTNMITENGPSFLSSYHLLASELPAKNLGLEEVMKLPRDGLQRGRTGRIRHLTSRVLGLAG